MTTLTPLACKNGERREPSPTPSSQVKGHQFLRTPPRVGTFDPRLPQHFAQVGECRRRSPGPRQGCHGQPGQEPGSGFPSDARSRAQGQVSRKVLGVLSLAASPTQEGLASHHLWGSTGKPTPASQPPAGFPQDPGYHNPSKSLLGPIPPSSQLFLLPGTTWAAEPPIPSPRWRRCCPLCPLEDLPPSLGRRSPQHLTS